MNLKAYYKKYCNILDQKLGNKSECESVVKILLNHFLDVNYTDIILDLPIVVDHVTQKKIDESIIKLLDHHPIQYVLGYEYFLDRRFIVNKSVLIPRPETEDLVYHIIKKYSCGHLSVLDIGTGSGCIAISLKKELHNATVHALDIDDNALKITFANAQNHHADIVLMQENVLTLNKLPQRYNIIVSNPPYVLESEKKTMLPNVLNHEPHLALFVPNDNSLIFYKKIVILAKRYLEPNGRLYFEINESLASEIEQLLYDSGFSKVSLYKDRYGKDRIVEGSVD